MPPARKASQPNIRRVLTRVSGSVSASRHDLSSICSVRIPFGSLDVSGARAYLPSMAVSRPEVGQLPTPTEARVTLTRYREGQLSLEELIDWAQALENAAPTDPWLRRTGRALANPMMCREEAMAFVRDLLES